MQHERKPPIGRLAPSPTGLLHVGHARSFLLAWWQMRACGGRIQLRLEDLDRERSDKRWEDSQLRDLEWLGLDWDGAVVRQSDELDELNAAVEQLIASGAVYPCVCTRREIQEAASAPHGLGGESAYPGTCRDRFESLQTAEARSGRGACLRLRVQPGQVTFEDHVAGRLSFDVHELVGDFPITRRDGQPAYQLAVVADDARHGVTHVLRGDDLLDSTPRQILVADALGLGRPEWAHVPLVHDDDGQRLAKRTDGLALETLRESGVDSRALVAWVARSAGMDVPDRVSAADALDSFDLALLPREPVRFGRSELATLLSRRK